MELYIEQERLQRNPTNGQWLPGHTSPTKGRKRTDFMSEETDKRLREIAAEVFRTQKHPEGSGVPKRSIVAVTKDGRWFVFPSISEAARQLEICVHNIGRCARQNASRKVKTRTWTGSRKKGRAGTKKEDGILVNTDHTYRGVRFYFEDDPVWTEKIRSQ